MKQQKTDDRLCSLLDLDRDASADAVFEAVQAMRRELSDANDTAGDLSRALNVIEDVLGIPPNQDTDHGPSVEAIEALKDERRGYELDYRQVVEALGFDADEAEVAAIVEEVGQLRDVRARGEDNGRSFREAAGLDPHAPVDRLIAIVRSMREEAVALRRMLALQAEVSSDVVFDAVDKLKRRASDQDVSSQERRELRGHLTRIAQELGLELPGTVGDIVKAIRKLKPQREAALSNAAWLAQAWETLTQHLRIAPGASLEEALAVIDEAVDVRDRAIEQFDFSGVEADEPLGPIVAHRVQAQFAATKEVGERLAQKEAQLAELRDRVHASDAEGQLVRLQLGLPSGASVQRVQDAIAELGRAADLVSDYDLLVERASAVSDLVAALTSANARLAVSLVEAAG